MKKYAGRYEPAVISTIEWSWKSNESRIQRGGYIACLKDFVLYQLLASTKEEMGEFGRPIFKPKILITGHVILFNKVIWPITLFGGASAQND